MIERRAFLAGAVTAGILAAPLAGFAQRPQKVRIGYLSGNPPSDTQGAIDAFQKRLRELGSSEGRDLLIEYRYAGARTTGSRNSPLTLSASRWISF